MTPDPHQFKNNEQFLQATMAATGLKDQDLAVVALNQMVYARGKVSEASEAYINAAIAFGCKNVAEVMMATHIIALHHQAVDLMAKAAAMTHPDLHKAYLNMALKLLRSFESLMETFQKCRRDGTYKMRVEHLHVHDGGQAIVGNVHQKGGIS
jgi:hypothetical protein